MRYAVADIECDGFNPTKIHVLSVWVNDKIQSTNDYDKMRSFLTSDRVDFIVIHNGVRFDQPVLERLLGIKIKPKVVCSLSLSWYLYPERSRHGLADWGEYFGVPKPKIDDWENLTYEEYANRCSEDVRINQLLWNKQWDYLLAIYGSEEAAWKLIDYLSFKMDCAREQEEVKWKLDIAKAKDVYEKLSKIKDEKTEALAKVMPVVKKMAKRNRPKRFYTKAGGVSAWGDKWIALCKEHGLPADYNGTIEVVTSEEQGNPGSHPQIKDWLYSLGWEPETFKYDRNKETNEVRQIPQINLPKEKGGGLCPSIKRLFDKEPNLELLDGLFVVAHRISILKGFLENVDEDGYIKAEIQGLTNTLRFKHRTVVNLPGIDKPYGVDVRGCLIAPEGFELCGSDMCSLEDRTKQHYMWDHDPDYVKEMMVDDFDPHIDLAQFAGVLPEREALGFRRGEEEFTHDPAIKAIRKIYKAVNYAAVYKSGAATLARTAGVSKSKGEQLRAAYWERNWAVEAIAKSTIVKTIGTQMWQYNPVSELWYTLRYDKDRFSTLNQGTGVWCFDAWVKNIRECGIKICGQFHDEVIFKLQPRNRDRAIKALKNAVTKVNETLKLNRELDCDVQFGLSYAEIH